MTILEPWTCMFPQHSTMMIYFWTGSVTALTLSGLASCLTQFSNDGDANGILMKEVITGPQSSGCCHSQTLCEYG